MANNVKEIWASGKAVVNAWLAIPSGFSAEVIAQCGFDSVTVDMVVSNLNRNVQSALATIAALVPSIGATRACKCGYALDHSIMTDPAVVSPEQRERLQPLLGRVWQ